MKGLERSESRHLQAWYEGEKRKPLIIRGARQVGKSTLVRRFAEQRGLRLVELNFERNPEFREAFAQNDPAQALATLEILTGHLLTGAAFEAHTALLFLDEIQAAPEAIAALRYFYEERPEIAILAAGSLLEFTLNSATFSMPVGRIEYMYLGPMSFSDYARAMGEGVISKHLASISAHEIKQGSIPAAVHEKCMALFRQYCVVGGMPEAVAYFAQTCSYQEALKIQSSILATYRDDFNKYSHGAQTQRVQLVFDRAASLIGHKFKYAHVSKDHRAAELRDALNQLCMARILSRVHHSAANGIPLGAEKKDSVFKLLFMDVGLLSSLLGINEINLQADGPHLINKGTVAEQFIGQHLLYAGAYYQEPQLFYWMREAKNAAAEVDYLLCFAQEIVPVEVKAGATGRLRSLHQFCQEKHRTQTLRFNAEAPSFIQGASAKTSHGTTEYDLLSLPLYMVGEARRLVNQLYFEHR